MRIVIDTNVLISGVFFGGFPREILRAVVCQKITACATTEIINEYEEIVQEMIDRKQGHINRTILSPLIKTMEIIEPVTHVEICRDPDDNKFLECAKDSLVTAARLSQISLKNTRPTVLRKASGAEAQNLICA